MTRTSAMLLVTVLVGFGAAAAAADNPVVGKWDVTATDSAGQVTTWTLVVKEDGGKLSGSLVGAEVTFELVDPKLDGKKFTFTIKIDEAPYAIETKIDGTKLEGTFKGPEADGTVKATRQS